MNEYVRYMNMRYEMAECAEVTRQVLGLTVPVSLETLMEVMKKAGIQCVPDESLDTDTRIVELPENPEYAFQVLYSIKINDRSLIFCLASALVKSFCIVLILRKRPIDKQEFSEVLSIYSVCSNIGRFLVLYEFSPISAVF